MLCTTGKVLANKAAAAAAAAKRKKKEEIDDNELQQVAKCSKKKGETEEGEEESEVEEESDSGSSTSSEIAVSPNDAKSKVKRGQTELEKNLRKGLELEEKIKEQKRMNAKKVEELGAARDEYPPADVDVSTVNSNIGIYDS